MCLNLSCYQFKTGAICEPHSNHKQKLIVNTQKKMRKESKQNKEESHQATREERQGRRKKQEQLEKQTSLPSEPPGKQTDIKCKQNVRDYFKRKWTTFSNQKIERLVNKKRKKKKKKRRTKDSSICFL